MILLHCSSHYHYMYVCILLILYKSSIYLDASGRTCNCYMKMLIKYLEEKEKRNYETLMPGYQSLFSVKSIKS